MIPVITVDGPSGTGKGTLSVALAISLGWHYLDSGALYRAVAYGVQKHAITPEDSEAFKAWILSLAIEFIEDSSAEGFHLHVEGDNVSDLIRDSAITQLSSKLAAIPAVRDALLAQQRRFLRVPGLVTDGRDMGTVVFPEAPLKVFLTASSSVRAKRRYNQLKEKGNDVSLAQIQSELAERDARDQGRALAPLAPADDAVILDTSEMTAEEVLARVMDLADRMGE